MWPPIDNPGLWPTFCGGSEYFADLKAGRAYKLGEHSGPPFVYMCVYIYIYIYICIHTYII